MNTRGFTLLEVMVSIAILGLGLTAILAAQTNAVSGVAKARTMSLAVGLTRCKMTEVEMDLLRDGFQELDSGDSGPCCEGDESSPIVCEWRIEKPTFPDPELGKLDLDSDLDKLGALGNLAKSGQEGSAAGPPGDISSVTSVLSGDGDIAQLAAGGVGGIASIVMSMVYPDLKTLFEASTRRITVIATWQEAGKTYELELIQWVTQPQPGPPTSPEDAAAAAAEASSTSSSSSRSSSSPSGGR